MASDAVGNFTAVPSPEERATVLHAWVDWEKRIAYLDEQPGLDRHLIVEPNLLKGPICATHDTVYTNAEEELVDEWGEPPCVFVWREPSILD